MMLVRGDYGTKPTSMVSHAIPISLGVAWETYVKIVLVHPPYLTTRDLSALSGGVAIVLDV